jgi:hypothetical protein
VDTSYPFKATLALTTTQPITYTWQATQHGSQPPHTSGLTDTFEYSWQEAGQKAVTVTASSLASTYTDVHTITFRLGHYLPLIFRQ